MYHHMYHNLIKPIEFIKFVYFINFIIILLNSIKSIDTLSNEQLRRYEIIKFDTRPTDRRFQPTVNHAYLEMKDNLLLVEINAFEQYFRLVTFVSDNQLNIRVFEYGKSHATHLNESYFIGHLQNSVGSKVMGYYTDDHRFIGLIFLKGQIYHLDLLKNDNDKVMMYRESDVIAINDLKASEPIQQDRFGNIFHQSFNKASKLSTFSATRQRIDKQSSNKRLKRSLRYKRERQKFIHYPGPVACHVELIADHTYAARFNYDSKVIANEMHLQLLKVNEIYQNTDFNQDGFTEGVSLRTENIIIFKDANATGYTYSNTSLTPVEILYAFSTRIQNYCLSFTFLNRDFGIFEKYSGTLGLAWLSTPSNHAGICSDPALNTKISAKNIVVSNVGLLTGYFRGKDRPRAECSQTLAHEIGHLFGARHDDADELKEFHPDWKCPDQFLMSSSASFGQTATVFTDCSKRQINDVLLHRSSCFKQVISWCGNGVVEQGEECDCGPWTICAQVNRCCIPNTCLLKQECKISRTEPVPTIPYVTSSLPNRIPPNNMPPTFTYSPNPPNYVPPNNINPNIIPPNYAPPTFTYSPNPSNYLPPNNIPPNNMNPNIIPPNYIPNRPSGNPYNFVPYQPSFRPNYPPPNYMTATTTSKTPTRQPVSTPSSPSTSVNDDELGLRKRNNSERFEPRYDLSDLNWTRFGTFVLFVIGAMLFLYCLLSSFCLKFESEVGLKQSKTTRRKKRGHKRLK